MCMSVSLLSQTRDQFAAEFLGTWMGVWGKAMAWEEIQEMFIAFWQMNNGTGESSCATLPCN
jgi:hypothetical protein